MDILRHTSMLLHVSERQIPSINGPDSPHHGSQEMSSSSASFPVDDVQALIGEDSIRRPGQERLEGELVRQVPVMTKAAASWPQRVEKSRLKSLVVLSLLKTTSFLTLELSRVVCLQRVFSLVQEYKGGRRSGRHLTPFWPRSRWLSWLPLSRLRRGD